MSMTHNWLFRSLDSTLGGVVDRFNAINLWHLLWMTVVLAEVFTAAMNTIMSFVWWGRFSSDLVLIGSVDALVVSLLVAPVIIYIVARARRIEKDASSEKNYRILMEQASDGIVIHDWKGDITDVNPRMAEMLGCNREDIIGVNMKDVINSDDLAALPLRLPEIHEGKSIMSERRFVRRDGTLMHAESSVKMLEDGRVLAIVRDIGERKRAEEALRESETKFRNLVEGSLDGVFILQKGKVVYANPRLAEIHGYSQDEIIGMDVRDVTHPEDRQFAYENIMKIISGEVPRVRAHMRSIKKDGTVIDVEVVGTHMLYNGEPASIGVLSDISVRKRAENALMESEAMFRSLVEESLVGVYIVQDGRLAYANPRLAEIHGCKREDLIGRDVSELAHPDDRELAYNNLKRLISGEVPSLHERIRGLTVDGKTVHFDVLGSKTMYNGKPAIIGTLMDVTARKRAEEGLQLLEKAVNTTTTGITISDCNGTILFTNTAEAELHGYAPGELIGKPASTLAPPGMGSPMEPDMLRSAGTWTRESVNVKKDGSAFPVRLISDVVISDTGEPVGIVTTCEDISGQKRADEEKEIMQAELLKARKMEAIGTLAGGVAHDFNNLLTVIKGESTLAMMSAEETDPVAQHLKNIAMASERAADLTRKLLLFSRQQPLAPVPLSLNRLLDDMLKMLRRLIGENISVVKELDPGLWTVKADPGSMEQVIMNLAVNASNAMPEGGRLKIGTGNVIMSEEDLHGRPAARPGEYVCLTVSDTGVGMDGETLQHIFDPFFSTKEARRGTGLGLSVVYGIAEQHGGWVDVRSEPGKGSEFRFYLQAVPEAPIAQSPAQPPLSKPEGNGERVLLVEDEDGVVKFVTRFLTKRGYKVFAATSAGDAERLFEEEKGGFDLVMSDVVLPDRSGIQLVDGLLEKKPGLPVLFCSGYTDHKSQWPLIRDRGFRFLEKPYSLPDLLRAIQESLIPHGPDV